jgi:hypothetical protein
MIIAPTNNHRIKLKTVERLVQQDFEFLAHAPLIMAKTIRQRQVVYIYSPQHGNGMMRRMYTMNTLKGYYTEGEI